MTGSATGTPTDLSRYRDYLLEIFAGAPGSPEHFTYRKQLEGRLHQSFITFATNDMAANLMLVPIVKSILTAPKGTGWGLGIDASDIEPRGDRTQREYLDYLIGLSKLSANELGRRYRLDLDRPDVAHSNKVRQNIDTLQRFYADSFQCEMDPHAPIVIPDNLRGRAPFFLEFEEWQRADGPFYGENLYLIRDTFRINLPDNRKAQLKKWPNPPEMTEGWNLGFEVFVTWFNQVIDLEALLDEAHHQYDLGQYRKARQLYLQAQSDAFKVLQPKLVPSFNPGYFNVKYKDFDLIDDLKSRFDALKSRDVKSAADIETFTTACQIHVLYQEVGFPQALVDGYDDHRFSVLHALLYLIPTCIADCELMLGDLPQATLDYGQTSAFLMARAEPTDSAGWDGYSTPIVHQGTGHALYMAGDLPYTADVRGPYAYSAFSQDWITEIVIARTNVLEERFFRLRHANAILEWADSLYRTDEPSNVARARELYKAALWIHGVSPPICPNWNTGLMVGFFRNHAENPALKSQKTRASLALLQIENDLNYYGASDDLVPLLRYRPLKDAADRFAASAKAAQQDFLAAMGQVEEGVREKLVTAAALKKAKLLSDIAIEQERIADIAVNVAYGQLSSVQSAIAAKKAEIDDHQEIGQQFVDWLGAVKDTVTGLPGWTTEGAGGGFKGELGLGTMGSTGGLFEKGGWLGLGSSGASVGAGFGVFVYVGIKSLVSIGDAQNLRAADLATLRDKVLPLASLQFEVRQREQTIAGLQLQIAQADAELAIQLFDFQATRILNMEFWASVAALAKRIMRRNLELGGRYGWLAERALAFEQDRPINIIRFDYFPSKLGGITGSDLLQLDLGELESSRIEGFNQTVPVKHTWSLAFDFPLAFGQLKKTGSCSFRTAESSLAFAYPGTYGYRVRAMTAACQSISQNSAERGILSNDGASVVSRSDGSAHVLLRPPDALPLSEFRMREDMGVFALPGEALLTFEGSGVDTVWKLEFPSVANPYGLSQLADVLITVDATARYSTELRAKQAAAAPKSVRRFLLMSARKFVPEAIEDLTGTATKVVVPFDLTALSLSPNEVKRRVKNLVLMIIGPEPLDFTAALGASKPLLTVPIEFEAGVVLSNAAPFEPGPEGPSPLNAFVDAPVDQTFELRVVKDDSPGIAFEGISDVILGVEYEADLNP